MAASSLSVHTILNPDRATGLAICKVSEFDWLAAAGLNIQRPMLLDEGLSQKGKRRGGEAELGSRRPRCSLDVTVL
jgi:hypothetical protein